MYYYLPYKYCCISKADNERAFPYNLNRKEKRDNTGRLKHSGADG
jgi:hypothetical protein